MKCDFNICNPVKTKQRVMPTSVKCLSSMSAPSTVKENQIDMVNIKARFPVKNKYKFSVGTNET